MPHGFHDRILELDLSSQSSTIYSPGPDAFRMFLGGSGLCAKIFFDRFPCDLDPLAPESPLMLMAGVLQGSTLAGSSRFAMAAKSPLTGIWGEGTCGGNFSPVFKQTGYDGLIITGAASAPVYLFIEEGKAEFRDAGDLWGKDTYETNDILSDRHGEGCRVLCIGPAGENGVKFGNVNNGKGDVVGRTGMGTVMGSKNLKAIVVTGTATVEMPDPARLKELKLRLTKKIMDAMPAQSLKMMGTDASMDLGMMTGDVPIKNWTVGQDLDLSSNLGGPAMTDDYLVKGHACTYCPVACKRVVEVKDGPYAMPEGPGPEYETCGAFGTMLGNPRLDGVCKVNEHCNKLGLDTITGGCTISFAMDCFEQGILTTADTDGLELTWGNIDAAIELVQKIAKREGFGDVLADGSAAAAVKIGKGSAELLATVKGLEIPMHDPRGAHGLGLAYMMSPIGASHMQHVNDAVERGLTSYPEVGMEDFYEGQTSEGKAELVKLTEDVGQPLNSMVLCQFIAWCLDTNDFAEMLNTVTGFDYDSASFTACGERIWLAKRTINVLFGVGVDDDVLPKKILTAVTDGPAEGSVPDMEKMRSEYYALRGLDAAGKPTREALEKVGLTDMAEKLYG